jgi:hypothetical protein
MRVHGGGTEIAVLHIVESQRRTKILLHYYWQAARLREATMEVARSASTNPKPCAPALAGGSTGGGFGGATAQPAASSSALPLMPSLLLPSIGDTSSTSSKKVRKAKNNVHLCFVPTTK